MVNKPPKKYTTPLYLVNQRPHEPLHEYVVHFFKATLEIPNLNYEVTPYTAAWGVDLSGNFFFQGLYKACELRAILEEGQEVY